jgi:hypothetical protein
MPLKQVRIGGLENERSMKVAIRDLETAVSELQQLAAVTQDVAPGSTQVMVRLANGTYQIWDLVSAGGCTITKDAVNKRLKISVP